MEEQKELDFHNSIPIEGEELKEAKKKAVTQQDQILEIFKREPNRWFTPYDIENITGNDRSMPELRYMLITSIRRAITNLTDAGYLVKGNKDMQVHGQWGMMNNQWKYNNGKGV
jgi:hypothetical protein